VKRNKAEAKALLPLAAAAAAAAPQPRAALRRRPGARPLGCGHGRLRHPAHCSAGCALPGSARCYRVRSYGETRQQRDSRSQ